MSDRNHAHDALIAHVRMRKANLVARLESGNRDWPGLREDLEMYVHFQQAADDLDEIGRKRSQSHGH